MKTPDWLQDPNNPQKPPEWAVKPPAVDPSTVISSQSAESLLSIEPPEFTAPMGLTLDMDRVKVTISKGLRNRMRLGDRFSRALLSGDARKKAKEDPSDLRCRARDTDPPAIQVIFDLADRIEQCDSIEDEKVRSSTMINLYKQMCHMITAFENNNTRLFTELWQLVEMHQRQSEHKDKTTLRGLSGASDADLIRLAKDADVVPG
jgi:hypothetical protein